ncbi:MAG: zinc ribbon domain-containing protein [Clostridium sp.]|jgi:hypothetical protein|nr:zinc ribbon domain-containing protein [Clostridium sp.]
MNCPNCGSPVEPGAFCTNCGAQAPLQAPEQQPYQQAPAQPYQQPGYQAYPQQTGGYANPADQPNGLLNFLGCCIPMAGLIMYLIMKDDTPNKAKAIGKWALIGLIANFVLSIIWVIVIVAMGGFAAFLGNVGLDDTYNYAAAFLGL